MRTQNLNEFKNKYFKKNNMKNILQNIKQNKKQIKYFYPKRERKQTDLGPALNSSLIDFRKTSF
jgi:hypothetical protein